MKSSLAALGVPSAAGQPMNLMAVLLKRRFRLINEVDTDDDADSDGAGLNDSVDSKPLVGTPQTRDVVSKVDISVQTAKGNLTPPPLRLTLAMRSVLTAVSCLVQMRSLRPCRIRWSISAMISICPDPTPTGREPLATISLRPMLALPMQTTMVSTIRNPSSESWAWNSNSLGSESAELSR